MRWYDWFEQGICTGLFIACVVVYFGRYRRDQDRSIRARERTFSTPDGGVFTFDRRLSDAEVAAFKARWRETYGAPGTAQEGTVCGSYRVPATAEDSGLCAGCGMFDYKHREKPDA